MRFTASLALAVIAVASLVSAQTPTAEDRVRTVQACVVACGSNTQCYEGCIRDFNAGNTGAADQPPIQIQPGGPSPVAPAPAPTSTPTTTNTTAPTTNTSNSTANNTSNSTANNTSDASSVRMGAATAGLAAVIAGLTM